MTKALNRATAPGRSYQEFLDLARRLGCVGVEPRNDLPRPLFDGVRRLVGREGARGRLPDHYSQGGGRRAVSLIPRVDGKGITDGERQANLHSVLAEIPPMLRGVDMIGLVEIDRVQRVVAQGQGRARRGHRGARCA